MPRRAQAAGAIVVRDGNHTPRAVTLASVQGAGAPAPGDRFGAALASGMLVDGRPCTDLLAGAPGHGGTGVLFGSTGASPRAATVLRAPDAAPGDEFGAIGATLGIAPDRPGLDEDEYDALLTGIPAGGILTLRGGYPAPHGRLAAPRDAPGYGSVFALPSRAVAAGARAARGRGSGPPR